MTNSTQCGDSVSISSFSAQDVLKFLAESGKINTQSVQEQMDMQRRKELLERHDNIIWKGGDGKWYTHLPDEQRTLIKRGTREELENVIVDFQKKLSEKHTVSDVFEEWINQKLEYGEIKKQSYDRYRVDFARFFVGTAFAETDIAKIQDEDIEAFIRTNLRDKELTNKAYSGLRTLIIGIFKCAKKKKYTDLSITNFMGDLDIPRNAFKKKRKSDSDNVFTNEEVEKIEEYVRNHETTVNLGVLLVFQTGLRAGELSALKNSDFNGRTLKVQRTEVRYIGEDGSSVREVCESTKTDAGNREIILGKDAILTLKKIRLQNPFGEYMFMRNGERIREQNFSRTLKRICKAVGIKERSMHKARKTYGTKLIDGKVDESVILRQMGHTDISCTKQYYYYNNKDQDEARKQIENAVAY